jgi:hypothetical protein
LISFGSSTNCGGDQRKKRRSTAPPHQLGQTPDPAATALCVGQCRLCQLADLDQGIFCCPTIDPFNSISGGLSSSIQSFELNRRLPNLESWLEWREAAERPVPGYVEDELRGYLECGLLCFGFARAVCMTCRTGFVVAARLSRTRQDGAMDGAACSPTGPEPSRRSRRSS